MQKKFRLQQISIICYYMVDWGILVFKYNLYLCGNGFWKEQKENYF